MSDNDKADSEKEARSASKSASPQGSVKSANRPPAHLHARSVEISLHSRSRSKPLCRSQSHSCYRSCRHISNRTKLSKGLNSCLGVFGLSFNTTEKDLREVFSQYGPLSDVCVVYNRRWKQSLGYGFVYFEKIDDAIEAKERANGMELNGHKIRVDYSATNRPRSPTSGINMGQRTFGRGGSRGPTCDSRGCDRGYDRGYDRNDDREYNRSYRKRSPSPYHRRAYRSRSRCHSPRKSSPQRYDGRRYDRGYDRNDDREYNRSYRKRSPSPYHRGAYRFRS